MSRAPGDVLLAQLRASTRPATTTTAPATSTAMGKRKRSPANQSPARMARAAHPTAPAISAAVRTSVGMSCDLLSRCAITIHAGRVSERVNSRFAV